VILTLASALLLATAAMPVAARQDQGQLLSQLDGLTSAHARKYIADRELGFASPVAADASTPDILLATVLEFDTTTNATRAFDTAMHGLAARAILGDMELDLAETAIDGLGDRAVLFTGVRDAIDGPEQVALLAVQHGNLGILLSSWGPDPAMLDTVRAIAEYMVDAEPSTEPVTIDGSDVTGATFAIMPSYDQKPLLRGLVPMWDYDLLHDGGEEPLNQIPATPER
jgi:hypothetical protein